MLPLDLYASIESAWCPGCGNFPMLKAFKEALAELQLHFRLNNVILPWMHLAFFSAAHTQQELGT